MLLTDYFRSKKDATWDYAIQSGVKHGVIRLPEDDDFDLTNKSHWKTVYDRFTNFGITPVIIEPMPNCVHDHIKAGDSLRDESIEKVIKMLPIMKDLHIDKICFNFMAHVGWTRTSNKVPERGGAFVTEFNLDDYTPCDKAITQKELWNNYEYFIKAVIPHCEKNGIILALHPDDPPLERLGNVERIFTNRENIKKALYSIVNSDYLGLTMCQANFFIMGENLTEVIEEFAKKIQFVHFRNTTGNPTHFRETFHDNGDIDMVDIMRTYVRNGIDVPIRVDHVPTMAGEDSKFAGYDSMGRLFAIGYLKGILQACQNNS